MIEQLVILGATMVIVTMCFYIVAKIFSKKKRLNSRIKDFIPESRNLVSEEENEEKKNKRQHSFLASFSKVFSGVKFNQKTERTLQQAGSELKPEEFLLIRFICSFGVGFALFITDVPFVLCLLASIPGFMVPNIYMKNKRQKRLKLLTYQLVETLGTMSNSLRAGFSFLQTMQLIGKEMPDPIGPEFDRAVKEMGIGVPMEEAFESLLQRLPNKELEVVIQAILAQRKSGGNLADLLDTMEETVRGRIRILDEVKTLTAQGKLSSIIITSLPVLLGVYFNFISPEYLAPMFNEPLGIALLSVGVISLIIGWLLIQKIVKIEV